MGFGEREWKYDVAGRRIVVRDGGLAIVGGTPSLVVSTDHEMVHVGCTALTHEAWRLLKEIVDAKLAGEHVA